MPAKNLLQSKMEFLPQGYKTFTANAGIKDDTLDLGIVVSDTLAEAAAVFTQNKIPGNPIIVGREHIKHGKLKAIIVNSKNANVMSGEQGLDAVHKTCRELARELNCHPEEILPSSTGVIGRPLPVEKILKAYKDLQGKLNTPPRFDDFAKAIMTTDTFPKFVSRKIGNASLVGVAKGSGMIEPNMATTLSYFFTDANISSEKLDQMLRRVVNQTLNCLSIDSDTSTSDTCAIMANGLAGAVNEAEFEKAFLSAAEELTRMLAYDGEGATKLFIVNIRGAASDEDARKVGKSIINSPLVKTAIYQGDPNWGRIYMAIGKSPIEKIDPEKIQIFWDNPPELYKEDELERLSNYLRENEELHLTIDLGIGSGSSRVYGCDLTEEYVKINAYYTT